MKNLNKSSPLYDGKSRTVSIENFSPKGRLNCLKKITKTFKWAFSYADLQSLPSQG